MRGLLRPGDILLRRYSPPPCSPSQPSEELGAPPIKKTACIGLPSVLGGPGLQLVDGTGIFMDHPTAYNKELRLFERIKAAC